MQHSALSRPDLIGQKNHQWKGEKVGYFGAHQRVRRARGKADHCEMESCPGTCRVYHWANLTGTYHDVNDYKQMCQSCHAKFDGQGGLNALLTPAKVKRIWALKDTMTQTAMAKRFGVSIPTINSIIHKRSWSKITDSL